MYERSLKYCLVLRKCVGFLNLISDHLCNFKKTRSNCYLPNSWKGLKENTLFPRNWLICMYIALWMLAHCNGSESTVLEGQVLDYHILWFLLLSCAHVFSLGILPYLYIHKCPIRKPHEVRGERQLGLVISKNEEILE